MFGFDDYRPSVPFVECNTKSYYCVYVPPLLLNLVLHPLVSDAYHECTHKAKLIVPCEQCMHVALDVVTVRDHWHWPYLVRTEEALHQNGCSTVRKNLCELMRY